MSVRVSGADFTNVESLQAVLRAADRPAAVTIDGDLPAGACRIAARLGRIDLDVPGQWAVIARLLDDMAAA